MSNKAKVKLTGGTSEQRRQKSSAPASLYLSPSLIGRFRKFVGRKSCRSRRTIKEGKKEISAKNNVQNDARLVSNLPRDAAAHFGTFYGVQSGEAKKPRADNVKNFSELSSAYRGSAPRLEFTRQMVQKLERTAGTKEYARQVSALLDETVEPAHFNLRSLVTENSVPDGKYNPSGYPLWYKEPFKMPFDSEEMHRLVLERFDHAERKARDIFTEKSSRKSSCEELTDYEEDDEKASKTNLGNSPRGENELWKLSGTESSSVTEAKDTDSKEGS